ncbi:DUF2000 domain-containing protein [Maridesulfovibrio sp.]|uniref:DUF2000 domain-containing protein n=1 Tax=Maridesulfovibrio sp. TaxID=2795000 RepID=UPI0029F5BA6B|nr:DUF2000 domain-containing protein [Maridesulfovibrio sp.]
MSDKKYVIVLDKNLPVGLQVNTAAVLATSIGQASEGVVGPDVEDGSGRTHQGITQLPIPILASDAKSLAELYEKASSVEDLFLVDFTSTAQKARHYDHYMQQMAARATDELEFVGIGLLGDDSHIKKLTGSLPLLR